MQRKTLDNTSTEMVVGGPAIVVILVILLGATVYLWRARYIRSRTAYVLMAAFSFLLIAASYWVKTQQG